MDWDWLKIENHSRNNKSSPVLEKSTECESSSALLNFLQKTGDVAARLHASGNHDLPQRGRRIWLLFHRKFINCLLKHCEILKARQI